MLSSACMRSVYKPRKNGLRSRVGGYRYLVEYEGYPDPKDFCGSMIMSFGAPN